MHYCFRVAFWIDVEAFSAGFLSFLSPNFHFAHRVWRNLREAFQVGGRTSMIRATRGRSMDGWMDGWSRPNHMPSHLDAL